MGKVNCFNFIFYCSKGKGVWFDFLKIISYTVEGARGWKLMFFPPPFDMRKEEGRGASFFLNFFFRC
jgi:hypothetical protein